MDEHAKPRTIRTERLVLRAPVLADASDIARLANNEKIHAVVSRVPFPYAEADAVEFITKIATGDDEQVYTITLADDGTLMGMIGLTFKPGKPPELGYWLGEPHWGKGYATEAVRAILTAWETAEPVIVARAIGSNRASRTVLEKTGFVLIGEAIDDCGPHKGVTVAEYRYEAQGPVSA